ncbi:YfiR family protein [Methylomonas sp. SURF-1]|uniref:YfiR family protein n=1 Tax=Methylomonas aurea TaxID=2952224 RepID=A0ABT1ULF3_9GAMM|nr:YfiR family protein [Methylomonas sp. SURF-1]MCQ8182539.1 YfiR family protein [Methylomonas sp. SURF-1]
MRRICVAFGWTVLCWCTAPKAQAEDNELEYKVKGAYLYNFTKFITWPAKASPTFNICIIGNDPFGHLLDPLESKTVQDKPIKLIRYDSAKQARDCDIAYFDNPDQRPEQPLAGVLTVGSLKTALTVSSQPFFAESGGMIGFVLDDAKVKLHINLKALKKNGLTVSAKLIEVATLVEGGEVE